MAAPVLRWGILGPGWIADQFVTSLRVSTRQVIQAVGSRSRASSQQAARRWGATTAHGSYAALVEDPDVEVVYVATPHNFHLPHALLAIEAGKHVLIEKPVGLSAVEAGRIRDAASAKGVFCQEAMWTLFLPKLDVIRQLLEAGTLGVIHTATADIGERFGPEHRIMRADLAGGPMLDLGTYPATFLSWVLGSDLEAVGAAGSPALNGLNAQIAAVLRSAGTGAVGSMSATILDETPTEAFIGGTKASIWLGSRFYRPGPFALVGARDERLVWDEPRIDHKGLHFEAAEVARCIAEGRSESPLRPFAESIATLKIMDAVGAQVGLDFSAAVAARDPT